MGDEGAAVSDELIVVSDEGSVMSDESSVMRNESSAMRSECSAVSDECSVVCHERLGLTIFYLKVIRCSRSVASGGSIFGISGVLEVSLIFISLILCADPIKSKFFLNGN